MNFSKDLRMALLVSLGFISVSLACGKDQGTSDSKAACTPNKTNCILEADGTLSKSETKTLAGGGYATTTTYNEDGTVRATNDRWTDENFQDGGERAVAAQVCDGGSGKTVKDSEGREWGYENGESCISL